ncbi:hypothetical protein HDU67_005171 [Dinochytrium kinnereticum]|nr:hypothetical protein HDU67_005171 [Dinochytrium kinnereticum]
MSDLRARKKVAEGSTPTTPTIDDKKKTAKRSTASICLQLFLGFFGLIALTLAASYLTTNTLTFGYPIPNIRKYLPVGRFYFPRRSKKPAAEGDGAVKRKEITLTTAELAEFDGSDPSKPIYLGINGKIYDVSAGPKYYGKGGGYGFFSGKDAARAYITGCFETHLTHDLRGLNEDQIKSLSQWTDFYENHDKYFYVGKVIHDPIPEDTPIPEDCNA